MSGCARRLAHEEARSGGLPRGRRGSGASGATDRRHARAAAVERDRVRSDDADRVQSAEHCRTRHGHGERHQLPCWIGGDFRSRGAYQRRERRDQADRVPPKLAAQRQGGRELCRRLRDRRERRARERARAQLEVHLRSGAGSYSYSDRTCAAQLDDDSERRLVEHGALLEQRLHVLLPVARLTEPRERAWKGRVIPAARDPRRVVHQPQRAQRFDQAQLAIVEVRELAVALEQVAELRGHLVARAREEQPQVLNGGAVHAVVEIDEVRTVICPEHVVAMAVAMDTKVAIAADLVEALLDRVDELFRDVLVARDEMRWQPVALEHVQCSAGTHLLAIEGRPLREAARRADGVDTAEKPSEPFAVLARAELGPAAPAPLVDGEPVAVLLVQAVAVVDDGRHDGNVLRRELERKVVLLENRIRRPAPRSVELHDDEPLVDADLIDAVLVAREPEDAARRLEAVALDGARDDVGRQVLVGNGVAHARRSRSRVAVSTASASSSERCFGCVARDSLANAVVANSA